jgi:hypothetical protein
MAFQLGSNFELKSQLPLDVRTVVANQTERNNLVPGQAYAGLIVYVTGENKYYYYNGTSWIELSITGGGGSGGTANLKFQYISSAATATLNTRVGADTTAVGFVLNLPLGASIGDVIEIIDINKTFHINNLIIRSLTDLIEGIGFPGLTCDVRGSHFLLIYVGGSTGWEISIIDNNFSTTGLIDTGNTVLPLLYLEIEGSSDLFDSPDSQNFKIPWNKIEWLNSEYVATGLDIDNSKLITYNPVNKNIYFRDSGIYNIDLRYGSFNLIDSNDFLRARLRSSNNPITGGLADPNTPQPRLPLGQISSNVPVLAAFAQGPIGTSFNGEAMQAGFTTFLITGNTYMTTDFLHFGAFNISSNQARGYPINNNDFGNQPFMFLTKII